VRITLRAAALACMMLAAAGCGRDGASDSDRLEVVASFYPVAEAAARVGGDRVEVHNLTPAGTEPHDLELTPRQVDRIEDADVVLYLGQAFQPGVEELAERRDQGKVDLLDHVALAEGASTALEAEEGSDRDRNREKHQDAEDPHFWLNPRLLAAAVDAVTEALATAAPADAETFRANAQRYKDELHALDADFERTLATCDRKEIVTAHAAFFYLGDRYGLTQLPITGLSPEAEPDAARLAELGDHIKSKGVTTVFYEELVSPNVANALAREAGVKTAVLNPIEGLTKEQLETLKDYAAVMRENLAALRIALGCR
jgi:zinc transport system substrate-binding protein